MVKKVVRILASAVIYLLATQLSFAATTEGIKTYQREIAYNDKQQIAADLSRYHHADNLWDVLRDEFSMPHYEHHPLVQEKIQWLLRNQDFLVASATRAAPYLYYILQQVKKRHLPAELVLLPIIESGYNPFAISNVGATGIWQMMPGTASGLGIKRDGWYDGRRDVIASTRAALNYLAYLQSFFEGNWLLAIAAYNTGEGNVLTAIRRNIREGYDTDFWSLPVAQQTRDYVPSLLALAIIISHPYRYPIHFPPIRNAPYLAQVDVGRQINLQLAAKLAGLDYKKIMHLNPGFTHKMTARKGPYQLILPIENVEQFTENLQTTPLRSPTNWIHYRTKTGDTLMRVARKFHTSTNAIRELNQLSGNMLHRGTDILIPRGSSSQDQPIEIAASTPQTIPSKNSSLTKRVKQLEEKLEELASSQQTNKYIIRPGDTIYIVREHDTLDSVARHFHTTASALRGVNPVNPAKLSPGQQLIIPTHSTTQFASNNKSLRPGDTVYMVRHGDTVEKIASKFHTSPAAVRIANLIDDSALTEGEQIVIPTHVM